MEQERDMNLPLSQSAPVHPSGHVHVKDPLLLEQFPPLWHRFCKHSLTSGSLQKKKKIKKNLIFKHNKYITIHVTIVCVETLISYYA